MFAEGVTDTSTADGTRDARLDKHRGIVETGQSDALHSCSMCHTGTRISDKACPDLVGI